MLILFQAHATLFCTCDSGVNDALEMCKYTFSDVVFLCIVKMAYSIVAEELFACS